MPRCYFGREPSKAEDFRGERDVDGCKIRAKTAKTAGRDDPAALAAGGITTSNKLALSLTQMIVAHRSARRPLLRLLLGLHLRHQISLPLGEFFANGVEIHLC